MEDQLPKTTIIPQHIAIIMDGNGRWAKKKSFNRIRGHRKGADTVRDTVTHCKKIGVKYLTLYAFSEENWKRPEAEISKLMEILEEFLVSERSLMMEHDIRFKTIGNTKKLPMRTQEILTETLRMTSKNQSMTLILALSYGGRDEIIRASRRVAKACMDGEISLDQINESLFSRMLDTSGVPDPDLLIRTSGEFRLSNFLPWQTIYSEIVIVDSLWPDFTRNELNSAIESFGRRERRFGKTSEQLRN